MKKTQKKKEDLTKKRLWDSDEKHQNIYTEHPITLKEADKDGKLIKFLDLFFLDGDGDSKDGSYVIFVIGGHIKKTGEGKDEMYFVLRVGRYGTGSGEYRDSGFYILSRILNPLSVKKPGQHEISISYAGDWHFFAYPVWSDNIDNNLEVLRKKRKEEDLLIPIAVMD